MATIEESIALVTGGNRGLGKEVCRQLLGHGFHVVLGSRDLKKGLAVAKEIRSDENRWAVMNWMSLTMRACVARTRTRYARISFRNIH